MKTEMFFRYVLSLLLFSGCAQLQINTRPEKIQGEACMESPRLQVLQVFDDGILGHVCPVDYPSYYSDAFDACISKGDLIYMPVKAKNNNYVDSQKVTLSENQCFVENGTYSYFTKDEIKKTVRKIKLLEDMSLSKQGK